MSTKSQYQKEPNWNIFREHINTYISTDQPDHSSQVSNSQPFSYLPDDQIHKKFQKITFEEIDYVPPCVIYTPPKSIKFSNGFITSDKMVAKNVEIKKLIDIDYDHFLNLHPVKYNNAKESICCGEIYMPVVTISDEGFPRVNDGRHRIVALYKYGFSEVTILVPESEKDEITNLLFNTKSRSSATKKKFISSIEAKTFTLSDFDFSSARFVDISDSKTN